MKRYELNPKEELRLETKPNTLDIARKNNRIYLIGVLILLVLCGFFRYVMNSIPNFYPLLVLIGLITAAGAIYYIYNIVKGAQGKSDEKYYITNVRVIVADNDENVLKEVYLSNINKVLEEKVTGKSSDVIINPKEETNPAKLRKYYGNKTLYTSDTMILQAVDAAAVRKAIGK